MGFKSFFHLSLNVLYPIAATSAETNGSVNMSASKFRPHHTKLTIKFVIIDQKAMHFEHPNGLGNWSK